MLGEETVDNSTWIVKTHYPLTQDKPQQFTADKIIYLTRHPIDVFPSFLSLIITQAHSIEPKRPWNEYKVWRKFIDYHIGTFKRFDEYIRKQAEKTPTFFMSYEQLILDPEPAVKDLFCFLLDVKSIEGTLVEKMVTKVTSKGNKEASS